MPNKSKCKHCKKYFVRNPENPIEANWVKFCSLWCRRSYIAQKNREKLEKQKVKKQKAKTKKAFSRSKLIAEADRVWSLYIRERDRWKPCITCWTPWTETAQAGHFMSRRHYNTRWEKLNWASQCVKCNNWGSGEQYAFAQALNNQREWLAEELQQIAYKIDKVTNEEILDYIRLYYRLLSDMWHGNDFIKAKKMYL